MVDIQFKSVGKTSSMYSCALHISLHYIVQRILLFVGAGVFHQPNIQIKLAECEEIGIFCRNFAEKFILKFAKLFYIKNTRIYAILQHNL